MRRRLTQILTATATSVIFASAALMAADPARPSTECLPDSTVAVLRVPDGQKAIDTLRENTKLGKVMFSKERIDNAFTKVKAEKPKEYADFEAELAKNGLKPEDLRELFTGDSGIAVTLAPKPNGAFKGNMIFWLEPKGDAGPRFYKAMQKSVEENKNKPVRTDLKIEGVDVMKIVSPRVQTVFNPPEIPENFDQMTADERAKFFQEQAQKNKEPKTTIVGYDVMFAALLGNRIIVTSAVPDAPNPMEPKAAGAAVVPADADATEAVFAEFLKAHLASGKATGFMDRMTKAPGLQQALPKGVVFAEGYADLNALVKMSAASGAADMGKDPKKLIESLGLTNIGPIAFRSTLEGSANNTTFFLSAPGPHKGILALLDQPELKPEPSAWATSNLVTYAHWSFDLAKAYKIIKDMAVDIQGPEAEQTFQQMEMQTQGMLQTDVTSLLASLGTKHTLGVYPIEPKPKAKEGEEEETAPEQAPMALVWNLTDQALWNKVFGAIKPLMGMAGGNVIPADEQGFTGYRSAPGLPVDGALMTGKNFLMFAFGPKVAEQTLSSLSTPPTGEASLKDGKAFAQAKTVAKLRPGVLFTLANNEKTGEQFIEGFLQGIEQTLARSRNMTPEEAMALTEMVRAILPKPEEMKGVYGVGVGQGFNSAEGLTIESITELPK